MIVIDGDSVALATRADVYPHQTWWGLLPHKTMILATPSATMGDCLSRIPMVEKSKPDFYILMAGQWSHNHEPLSMFAQHLDEIATRITKIGIRMLLITPPYPKVEFAPLTPFVDEILRCADKYKDSGVSAVNLYRILETLDIYATNNIHLGVAGNKLLAEHVAEALEINE